nr:protein GPR107-like [Paramormyrops kingsleyae]
MAADRRCAFRRVLFILLIGWSHCRQHHLILKDDVRQMVHLNSFGFYKDGYMNVSMNSLVLHGNIDKIDDSTIGFSLDRTNSNGFSTYLDEEVDYCALKRVPNSDTAVALLLIDFQHSKVRMKTSTKDSTFPAIVSEVPMLPLAEAGMKEEAESGAKHTPLSAPAKAKGDGDARERRDATQGVKTDLSYPLQRQGSSYSFQFHFNVSNESQQGLYNFYFHNCYMVDKQQAGPVHFSIDIKIEEKNPNSYLSAGEIPLPKLYIFMSIFFFLIGVLWVHVLRTHRADVFSRLWNAGRGFVSVLTRARFTLLLIHQNVVSLLQIVCYIYFTRIIAILIKFIVPFQWKWLYQLLDELATLVFFFFTGHKFRPASHNPYLLLSMEEDEDMKMEDVVTTSTTGMTEGVKKVKKVFNGPSEEKESMA